MPITYTQTDALTDCSDFSACATGTVGSTTLESEIIEGGTAGTTEQSTDIPASSSRLISFFQTSGGVSSTSWDSGNYTVRWNVTTSQNNTSITGVWICRIDSSCSNLASVGSDTSLSIDISGGGIFSTTVSGTSQSASSTDDLYIITEITNSHSMTSRSVGITPDQNIDTPISKSVSEVGTASATGTPTATETISNAFFDATIDSTNSPVSEGNTLDVNYTINNTGDAQDTQDIELWIINPVHESFEHNDLSGNYSGELSNTSITSTTPPTPPDGSLMLQRDSVTSTGTQSLYADAAAPDITFPSAGDTFRFSTYADGTGGRATTMFFMYNGPGGTGSNGWESTYYSWIRWGQGSMTLSVYDSSGNNTHLDSTGTNPPTGEWLDVEIFVPSDPTVDPITMDVYDSAATNIASLSGVDSATSGFTSGEIGWRHNGGDNEQVWIDYVRNV